MQARIWGSLKGIVKVYGMSKFGVIIALFGGFISITFWGIMWSVAGVIPGYFVGDYLAKSLHDGRAQRMIGWYFGSGGRGRRTPDTSIKMFF